MSEPIVYIDRSQVRDGKLEQLKLAIRDLVAFIDANVPRAMTYRIYLNESGGQMTVVQIHPDSTSLEFHMRVGAPEFSKFKDLIRLSSIDVYGEPSDALRKQLEDKVRMLGAGAVSVHKLQAGFMRLTSNS
jgi:hypothetical protein